jgi:protein involved in polysaccharide export with SLBB domain
MKNKTISHRPYMRLPILGVLFLLSIQAISGQTTLPTVMPASGESRLLEALSTTDYRVTPGDVYQLAYLAPDMGLVNVPLTLDASYQLRIQHMGILNTRDKTFLQLKTEVENLVSRNFSFSGVSFTLTRIGRFEVPLTGEILEAGNRMADSLTRVSAFVTEGDVTKKASLRFVRVTSSSGSSRTYDLFQARRFGDFSQDPYLKRGDQVQIPAANRIVEIHGEVFRPGRYELLPGEGMKELVEYYGDGFTLDAAPEKISILRAGKEPTGPRQMISLSWTRDMTAGLQDGDIVSIANKSSNRQAVFFEGALSLLNTLDSQNAGSSAIHIPYTIYSGETLGSACRSIEANFYQADLRNAYILREQSRISVNIEEILYRNNTSEDRELKNGDIIVIPFLQYYALPE